MSLVKLILKTAAPMPKLLRHAHNTLLIIPADETMIRSNNPKLVP